MTLYLEAPAGIFTAWFGQPINGIRYPRSIESLWLADELAAIGLYDPAPADPVPDGKISTAVTVDRVEGVVRFVHTLVDRPTPTIAERRQDLIQRVEQVRWEKETGGLNFAGAPIPTDDRAKTLIMGARTAAVELGDTYEDEWKIAPGLYVTLDAATAVALGDALREHVKACFAREKVLTLAILAASTHPALDAIEADIETGWPT